MQIKQREEPAAEPKPQLEISRRLLGCSAVVSMEPGARDITVALDVEGLVRRLLLFDTYVLYSVRLKEIPEMVRHFGYEGTIALLTSGALEIRCECAQYGEGQFNTPPCPQMTYQFHVIEAHGRDQYLINNLSHVNETPGLSSTERMRLRSAVVSAVQRPDNRMMFSSLVAPTFDADLMHNTMLVKAAVRVVLAKEKGVKTADFDVKLHKIGDDRYRVETDLDKKLTLKLDEIHDTIKVALLGISAVDQRLGEMNVHSALSGFTAEELPLFDTKLGGIGQALGSEQSEQRFQRIVDLAGLPAFSPHSRIDIERLLRIRAEPEAVEFRGWLPEIDKYSDREIHERITSFNVKLGLAVQSTTGKIIRLAVTTAASLAPVIGIPASAALQALDLFAWDKFCRRSGIAAFVNELYPSIFPGPRQTG